MILPKHPLDAAPRHAQVRLVRSSLWRVNAGVGYTVVSVQAPRRPQAEPLSQQQTPSMGVSKTGVRGMLKNGITEVRLRGDS